MALQGTPRSFLGLDIGATTIKLVELISRGRSLELTTYGLAKLTPGQSLPIQIADLMRKAEVTADATFVSLPNQHVFTATVNLPNLPDAKIADAIRWQARSIIPTELSDTHLTWHPLINHGPLQQYFLVATPNSVVSRLKKLIDQLDLNLLSIEPEALALARASQVGPGGPHLICNIDGDQFSTHVVDHPNIFSTTVHSLVDSQLTADQLHNLLLPIYQQVEVKRTLFTGHQALTPNLLNRWTKLSGRRHNYINPWLGLTYPPHWENHLPLLGSQLAVAIGLARQPAYA